MDDTSPVQAAPEVAVESKKRKRTGKDRKEAKALAEQAQARMAAIIAQAKEEPKIHVEQPEVAETKAEDPRVKAAAEAAAIAAKAKEEAAAAKKEPESIAGRIPQGLKAIHPLLKQAKTFETQRLIKKVRWSRDKKEDVSDMESQITALSEMNLNNLAISHLRTKISKHHQFKHSPLPTSIFTALESPTSADSSANAAQKAKAENRLISSKIVADGMKDILGWVMGDPGARLLSRPLALAKEKEKMKGKGMDEGRKRMLMDVKDEDEDADDRHEEDGSDGDIEEDDEGISEGESGDDEVDEEGIAADAAGWESGSVDDIGDDDDEDSEEQESDAMTIPKKRKTTPKSNPVSKAKSTPVPLAKPVKPTKVAKPGKPTKREDITSSLFLPSLASGFTRGDSDDSDPDMDFDADGSGMVGKQGVERKNRRGQRARQAIWEKKYGSGAKHVIKNREADNAAQGESNIKNAYGKRAATTETAAPTARTPTARPERPTYTPAPRPVSSAPPPAAAPAAGGGQGLHPSWEAARKKKLLLAAAPAAQKIVFD